MVESAVRTDSFPRGGVGVRTGLLVVVFPQPREEIAQESQPNIRQKASCLTPHGGLVGLLGLLGLLVERVSVDEHGCFRVVRDPLAGPCRRLVGGFTGSATGVGVTVR